MKQAASIKLRLRVDKRIRFLTSILFVLSFFISLKAQGQTAIRGSVGDEQGGKVAGARVLLSSRGGLQFWTATDSSGNFEFRDLKPGLYLVEVRADGFAVFATDEISLEQGMTKQVKVTLRVAAINANVVVTATGTVERADEVAKVISTLGASEIEAKHELNLGEALRGIPGVRVQQQGSPGALTTIRLRGQRASDTALLLDGLRVRDAGDINGSALSLMSDLVPVSLDRVEILRGAGSSIYGTLAIGGAVNLIPQSGAAGFHLTAGFEGGGLGTFREHLQLSGGTERIGYSLGLNRLDVRKGIDGEDQYGNSGFAGRFQFNPTGSITVAGTFYGTIANSRINDSPFALSDAFTSSEPFPAAVPGTTFEPDFNNPDQGRRNQLLVGSFRFSQLLGDRVSYSIAYQRTASNRRNYNGSAVDPRYAAFVPFGDFEFLNVNRGAIDTVDARVNLQFSRTNLATAGFEFERESFFQSAQPSFSVFNNTTDRQRTFAVFGQDQLSFLDDRLRLSAGIRQQGYRIRGADRPGSLLGKSAESSITADGAVSYTFPGRSIRLRAHIGNGFRAPSLFERFGEGILEGAGTVRFGDPTLRAEQSISVDGGIDQRFANDRWWFGATYFYTRLRRVVTFTGFAVDPLGLGRFSGYENRPGGLSRGVESFLNASPGHGMDLRASYTFTNSDRFVPLQGLRREYVIPKHLLGFNWTQRYRALLVSLDLNRTGSYLAPVFENNFPFRMAELKFNGYTKADVFGSYERHASEKVSIVLFGGVENLLNQVYFENGFLAPGTVARVGINVKF